MALFFCGAIALTLVAIAFFPRSYSSEAKLFIRVGRETVALDPTATTGQTILLQKSQVDEINSALDVLGSGEVQRQVVDLVGAGRILNDAAAGGSADAGTDSFMTSVRDAASSVRAQLGTLLTSLRLSDPGTEEERAVRRLEKGIRVWAPKESTIITVSYRAATPQLAHDVVDAMTKVFLEQHLRLNHAEGSLQFFSQQADTLHGELAQAQAGLRDRKNEFHIASMSGKRAMFEEQIKDVELQLLGVQRDLAYSEAKAADLTRTIASLEPEIVTSRVAGIANEARDGMREKLYELELEESKLRSSYQDQHPLLMQIRQQREEAEQILAGLPDDRTQTTSALNSNQRELELQLIQAKSDTEALRARQKTAQGQLGRLHEQLLALNDLEVQIDELERNVDLLEQKYRMHAEKLEQARVNDELGRSRINNVKVAQPATLMSKPVSPNKRLLVALGLILATGGALGMAFLAETIDQTFRTIEQIERQLGLPVLLSLPARRRRRHRASPAIDSSAAKSNGRAGKHVASSMLGSYRELLSELLSANGNGKRHAKTVGVIGFDNSNLRSRVAAELAAQAANIGAGPVLLIDGDAHRRRIARRFHVSDSPGWREMLAGVAEAANCIHRPQPGNLAVMAPGGTNGHTLTAERLIGVPGRLDKIKSEYGLVVVDLPSGREWEGPTISAEWLDQIVLVIDAERTRIQSAQRAKLALERAGIRLTGVVLANRKEHIPGWLDRRL
ncbi:MAG: hypothetical protein WD738_03950 [Pirellulales bacterium]